MITVKLVGGQGNQMFQYAMGRALALKNNTDLYLDMDHFFYEPQAIKLGYRLDLFNIQAKPATKKQKPRYLILWKNKFLDKIRYAVMWVCKKLDPRYIIENPKHPKVHIGMYDFQPRIIELKKKTLYLEGFWQSENYFASAKETIRKELTLKTPISDPKNVETIAKMEACNAVSLHVRRDDYAGSQFEGICSVGYYQRAVAAMKEKVEHPIFFVFSDDIKWCKENIDTGDQTHFIDRNTGDNSFKDMMLMTHCKHHIVANSSFSWRGAWLDTNPTKVVIAPKRWHQTLDYADIVPAEWIRM